MIKGVWTALPDVREYSGAEEKFYGSVQTLLEKGVDGLFVLGTTGRGTDLSLQIRMQILETLVKKAQDPSKLVVNVSANPSEDVQVLIEHAQSLNVHGVALTPPFYGSYTEEEMKEWVSAALERCDKDKEFYFYNIPSVTHTSWSLDLLDYASTKVKIAGLKDSSGQMRQCIDYLKWAEANEAHLLVGDESLLVSSLMLGTHGVVSGLSSASPELVVNAYQSAKKGDWETAILYQKEINQRLTELSLVSPRKSVNLLVQGMVKNGIIK
jgi:dihydrodipicolinate synthase/N-acetylneuraminate lyase